MLSVSGTMRVAEGTVTNTGERSLPVARPRFQRGYLRLRSGNWELRYRDDLFDAAGKLHRRHRSVVLGRFSHKKQALRAAEAFLRPLNQGTCRPQMDITLSDFWSRYFEPEVLPTLKFSTRRLYRCLARKHLLPWAGEWKLSNFTPVQIQQFVGLKQREGYSPQTLRHLKNLLSNTLGIAVSWGWLTANPVRNIKLPAMERIRESRVLSVDDVTKLCGSLPDAESVILLLGVLTGLRVGELLALRIQDVDLSAGFLYVRRDVYCGHVGTPKTKAGERRVPLASILFPSLQRWLKVRLALSEWFFPSERGTPLRDRNVLTRRIWPVCDRLDIPRFGWHSLRHTFSTIAANAGVPLPVLKLLLGHGGSDVTMLYVHGLEGEARAAVEKVAGVLCPSVPKVYPSGVLGAGMIQ